MNYTGDSSFKDRKIRYCPFLDNPFDDCYCMKFTGMDVENMVIYCAGNFKECPVYCKNIEKSVRDKERRVS